MNGAVNLGPLALATDRLLAVALLIGFLFAVDRILARESEDAVPATGLAVVGGLIAARIAYILQHRDAFAYDWWSVFAVWQGGFSRSEEHTSELQSLMRISYAVFCLKKKIKKHKILNKCSTNKTIEYT